MTCFRALKKTARAEKRKRPTTTYLPCKKGFLDDQELAHEDGKRRDADQNEDGDEKGAAPERHARTAALMRRMSLVP